MRPLCWRGLDDERRANRMTQVKETVATSSSARTAFYQEIDTLSMTPLWELQHALVPR